MRGLAADSLLGLWEQAEGLPSLERALLLAGAAGADPDELRDLPLGDTHGRLLELRGTILGPVLTATAGCPACGERVELDLDVSEPLALRPEPVHAFETADGRLVVPRPPTPTDIAAAAEQPDPVGVLQDRCVTVSAPDGEPTAAQTLSEEDLAAAEAAMAGSDPLAEILVALDCPACGTSFEADLDVAAFVWAELDAAARRLLVDIDRLARAYGWTEPEVLALSDARRAAYLRLVDEGAP